MDKQEHFWAGQFGNDYTDRNKSDKIIESNKEFFTRALKKIGIVLSDVIELGANCGLNLIALNQLYHNVKLTGVELNSEAFLRLNAIENVTAVHSSLYDLDITKKYDFAFTKGVLIHLNPDRLTEAYDMLYNLATRHILIAEYYNPTPQEIKYRGNSNVLFKRDFAGEMLDRFKSLSLIDYGFCYHRDIECPQDDLTWFLMRKMD